MRHAPRLTEQRVAFDVRTPCGHTSSRPPFASGGASARGTTAPALRRARSGFHSPPCKGGARGGREVGLSRLGTSALCALAAWLVLAAPLAAQQTAGPATSKSDTKAKASKGKSKKAVRRGRPDFYMGRPIAQVMSFHGADWLFRESREQEERPEEMLNALKIPAGATVADVGAGAGYMSMRLARRVGPEGTVLATDVQPEMLAMLAENLKTAGIENVRPIRATQTDTKLPEGKVDLVLMVDVYHEASDPETLLQGLRKALKPGGRLVLVEFRGEDPEVPIKPEHKMTLAQVRKEVEPQGFTFKDSLEFLPWQHIIIFEKPKDDEVKTK